MNNAERPWANTDAYIEQGFLAVGDEDPEYTPIRDRVHAFAGILDLVRDVQGHDHLITARVAAQETLMREAMETLTNWGGLTITESRDDTRRLVLSLEIDPDGPKAQLIDQLAFWASYATPHVEVISE